MANRSATISFENFDRDRENAVVAMEVDWAAQLAGPVLHGERQAAPAEDGIVEDCVETRPTTRQYCRDADMLVVRIPPTLTFAIFVAKFRPLLHIRHMSMSASGARVLAATTFMAPEPYVRSIAFRLHIMDASVASLSIPLLVSRRQGSKLKYGGAYVSKRACAPLLHQP